MGNETCHGAVDNCGAENELGQSAVVLRANFKYVVNESQLEDDGAPDHRLAYSRLM